MKHRFTILTLIFLLPILGFSQSKKEIGKKFLRENVQKLNLTQADVSDYFISDMYTTKHSGVTHVYFNQSYNGIPVNNAIINVNIRKDNTIQHHGNRFIADLDSKISGTQPTITPEESVLNVAKKISVLNPGKISMLKKVSRNSFVFNKTHFTTDDIKVDLQYYALDKETVRLVWNVTLAESYSHDSWHTKVDAITGEILKHRNMTIYCNHTPDAYKNHSRECRGTHKSTNKLSPIKKAVAQTETTTASPAMVVDGSSYRVYPLPAESPLHGSHEIVNEPADPTASPYGWHDADGNPGAEFTITRGNNVHAFQNLDASNVSAGDEPEGGANLAFDFSFNADSLPENNVNADVVNLFYMNNMMHDLSYLIGFDEAAGNFQINTYDRGGVGGDFVRAQALDGSDTNNASFAISAEGNPGTMRMYKWDVGGSRLFRVTEPMEISGNYTTAAAGDGWGFDNTYAGVDITAPVAIALDNDVASPQTMCDGDEVVSDLNGKIALIQRGLCQFGTKARRAEAAGAVAVIICNVPGADGPGADGNGFISMTGGNDGLEVTIPTIMMGTNDCQVMIASIEADIPVTANIMPSVSTGPAQVSSGFDNGVVAHEYGHGISSRLIGGASNVGCLGNGGTSEEQMGEGISDWFSLVMTAEEGDTGADSRGIGAYVNDEEINGRGIRRFPYSTDMSINPQTYDNIIGQGVHSTGEIWAGVTWDIYWAFVDLYGFDKDWTNTESGNHRGMRLVVDGMKGAPCNPGFLDMRDALLAADDGQHTCTLWEIFARRGIGFYAEQNSPFDNTDGVQDFEPLPTCIQEIKIRKSIDDFITGGDELEITLEVANHTLNDATNALVTDLIPEGLDFISGSSTHPATVNGNEITFDLGDYPSLSGDTIVYSLKSDPNNVSDLLYKNEVETPDEISLWERVTVDPTSLLFFGLTSVDSYSPTQSWFALEEVGDTEQVLQVNDFIPTGDYPVLRVYHRMNTISGLFDGGFIEVSTDGGIIWQKIADKMLLDGYSNFIQYTTFAIPNLLGFAGPSAQGEFEGTYIDLSEFKDQKIDIRFRFGTAELVTPPMPAPNNGWYIDNLELIDMKFYDTQACFSTSIGEDCTENFRTFIDAGLEVGSEDFAEDGLSVKIFPNPASDFFQMKITSENQMDANLSITSLDGRTLKQQPLKINARENNMIINTSDLTPGFYFVQLQSGGKVLTKKIVIE